MIDFRYNDYGYMMTGFENSIDHAMFGHWLNPEYQELQQMDSESQKQLTNLNQSERIDEEYIPF